MLLSQQVPANLTSPTNTLGILPASSFHTGKANTKSEPNAASLSKKRSWVVAAGRRRRSSGAVSRRIMITLLRLEATVPPSLSFEKLVSEL